MVIRAVTPQLFSAARDQAITSSRIVAMIPPWVTPNQPSKRSSRVNSHHDRRSSRWSDRCRPCSLSSPQAKQLCGSNSNDGTPTGERTSDVKVLDLAGLGLDEVLARRHLLAHQHR